MSVTHHGTQSIDIRPYMAVFAALLVLTVVTVAAASLELPATATVVVAVAIASVKAALVAMFFMHLKGERPVVMWSLGLTGFLFAALFAFVLWTEGDRLTGTRFMDAFGSGPSAGAAAPAPASTTSPGGEGGH